MMEWWMSSRLSKTLHSGAEKLEIVVYRAALGILYDGMVVELTAQQKPSKGDGNQRSIIYQHEENKIFQIKSSRFRYGPKMI